jgi:hypothetical protein
MQTKIDEAWKRAAECIQRAEAAATPETRAAILKLRDSWIDLANRLQFVEAIKENEKRLPGTDL